MVENRTNRTEIKGASGQAGWRTELQAIGQALDARQTLYVGVGGFVSATPKTRRPVSMKVEENARFTETDCVQPADASDRGSSGSDAPFVGNDVAQGYLRQVNELQRHYPETELFRQQNGIWLLVESGIIEGYPRVARFLLGIHFDPSVPVQTWAYWGRAPDTTWIGPRHTNLADGTVCAFVPSDGTWDRGAALLNLLDIYATWAVRQAYLEEFGKWPGLQADMGAYYRLTEVHSDELCSCDRQKGLIYRECCLRRDERLNKDKVRRQFERKNAPLASRRSPPLIDNYMRGKGTLPIFAARVSSALRHR